MIQNKPHSINTTPEQKQASPTIRITVSSPRRRKSPTRSPSLRQKRFIKLLGSPQQLIEQHPSNPPTTEEQRHSVTYHHDVKREQLDQHSDFVDLLDAENEDPFSLESLDRLITLHSQQNKDFLLAKVTTVDPHDEQKQYYSYYSAHHINKVLFRTQPSEGLLHRMRAKNPLNNMTIMGDVHYFVIKAFQFKETSPVSANSSHSSSASSNRTFDHLQPRRPRSADSTLLTSITKKLLPFRKKKLHLYVEPEKATLSKDKRRSSFDSLYRQVRSQCFHNQQDTNNVQEWVKKQLESNVNSKKHHPLEHGEMTDIELMPIDSPYYYTAVYYGSDDDFLMKPSVRKYFKENALEDEDAVLFTIPNGSDRHSGLMPHPILPNVYYTLEDSFTLLDVIGSKWFWIGTIVYILLAVFILKFAVPLAYVWIGVVVFVCLYSTFLLVLA